ncbi:D-aspartate oxidase-like [Culicoides brevitarsis]|uniref:D-aspartate oxidase-like n=1 Tax=Culicoides brevitarsis TaxID=469753 RepID=UPI00307B37A1
MKFCVIGAGVQGISAALELQSQFRNSEVTLIADKFCGETTSDVAAGIFRPTVNFTGASWELSCKVLRDSYEHWDELRKGSDAGLNGVTQLSGYIFSKRSPETVKNPLMKEIVPLYRTATQDELELCNGGWKYGSFYNTLITDCGLYLPWALKKFKQNGGKTHKMVLKSFSELQNDSYDVVINCAGLGSRFLCNDTNIVPIRGQVYKVHAPWIKMAFYADDDTYAIPGCRSVSLGTCSNFDNYNTEWNEFDAASIRQRCFSLLPSLKNAKIIEKRVGLRPYRNPLRLEIELKEDVNGKVMKIVHNYGHGAFGVMSAPGCAKFAVNLARDAIKSNSKL